METLTDEDCILQVDFTNAFNLVSRSAMFDVIASDFPSLLNVVEYLYGTQGFLRVGYDSEFLASCVGVQQGCPLAPFLFSCILKKITDALVVRCPELSLNMWYLDDGHIAGPKSVVLDCLNFIATTGSNLGLHLNLSKCVIFGP